MSKPTKEQAAAYQLAFDYFNLDLFDGKLPFAYLNFSRHAGALGFFAPNRWQQFDTKKAELHEISLNPDMLLEPPVEYYSTLVHEMAHLWQQCFGEPSRNGYHNREWAEKMEAIGLMPSATGQPGGKKTGQRMTHYIMPDGAYVKSFQKLPTGAYLPYVSGKPAADKKPSQPREKKHRFTCPSGCEIEVWAKLDADELPCTCTDCGRNLTRPVVGNGLRAVPSPRP